MTKNKIHLSALGDWEKGLLILKEQKKTKKQKNKNKIVENLLDFSTIISICIITIKYFEKDSLAGT